MSYTLLIVLGAGASKGCNLGSVITGTCHDKWEPPITDELFDSRFEHLRTPYQYATPLINRFYTEDIGKTDGFEAFLEKIEAEGEKQRVQVQILRLYIHRVISTVSNNYFPSSPGTAYTSLFEKIDNQNKFDKILCVNLNYDTFADTAIKQVFNQKLESLDRYLNINGYFDYIKAHGSINWFKQFSDDRYVNTQDVVNYMIEKIIENKGYESYLKGPIIQKHEFDFNKKSRNGDPVLFPVMVAPILNAKNIICDKSHRDALINGITMATSLVVIYIGYSGKDEDINELIANFKSTVKKLYIYDPEPKNIAIKVNKIGIDTKNIETVDKSFAQCVKDEDFNKLFE